MSITLDWNHLPVQMIFYKQHDIKSSYTNNMISLYDTQYYWYIADLQ